MNEIENTLLALGSLLGAASFLFGAVELLIGLLEPVKLNLIITNDIFYRLIAEGESMFTTIIIVGERKLARITDIGLKLVNSQDGRNVEFKIRRVGKNRETDSPFQEFSFYSNSVFDFITPNESKTIVLHSIEVEKDTEITKIFNLFDTSILGLKPEVARIQSLEQGEQRNNEALKLIQTVGEYKQECLTAILQLIKIEDGDYQLTVNISYKGTSNKGFWFFKRFLGSKERTISESKKISFNNSGAIIRNDLETFLMDKAGNILNLGEKDLTWPTVNPTDISD